MKLYRFIRYVTVLYVLEKIFLDVCVFNSMKEENMPSNGCILDQRFLKVKCVYIVYVKEKTGELCFRNIFRVS